MECKKYAFLDVYLDQVYRIHYRKPMSAEQILRCFDDDNIVPALHVYLQKTNPFWRSIIIHRCNRYVQSLIDENTIYSNTDCIVSAVVWVIIYSLNSDTFEV
mgnify:CR=1 FL=1